MGAEDGSHVDHIHPQIPQVGELFRDARQISSQVGLGGDGGLIPDILRDIPGGGEPGGKDLVDHLARSPLGNLKPLLLPQGLGAVEEPLNVLGHILCKAGIAVKNPVSVKILQLEAVAQAHYPEFQGGLVVIPEPIGGGLGHGEGLSGVLPLEGDVLVQSVKRDTADVIFPGLKPEQEFPGLQTEAEPGCGLVPDCGVIHGSFLISRQMGIL